MSRYVDLDGLTWDGTKISSHIQEVKTQHYGYMQGITVGWLWDDNVPHIDLESYEEDIRRDERLKVQHMFDEKLVIDNFVDSFSKESFVENCDWRRKFSNGWQSDQSKQKYKITNPHNDIVFLSVDDYKFCPYCGKRLFVK